MHNHSVTLKIGRPFPRFGGKGLEEVGFPEGSAQYGMTFFPP